jgi:hypothetical protein
MFSPIFHVHLLILVINRSETTETPEEETLDDCRELVIASIDKVNQLSIASITGETRHILTGANPAVDMVSPHALSPSFCLLLVLFMNS